MYTRILVPIDGSEHAKQALSVACKLVDKEASTLYLLHVPETRDYTTTLVWGIGAIDASATLAEREKAGEQLLKEAITSAQEEGAQYIEKILMHGDPVRVILDTASARDIDTIVMGSRGLSDFAGVVIGSVSHKVSHSAKCQVITVSK